MLEKFKTRPDARGNVYTLKIDHESRHFSAEYNTPINSHYVTIGKKARAHMIEALREAGYTETTRIYL